MCLYRKEGVGFAIVYAYALGVGETRLGVEKSEFPVDLGDENVLEVRGCRTC
jgi:hypothetical protein